MSRLARLAAAPVALALVLGGLVGCTPTATDRPVVLHIVTDDDAAKPAGQQILHLASAVRRLSHGALTISPRWHAAGTQTDFDQANARLVMSGEDELGLIPSRAWDRLGVSSLRALTTPFLLTSDAQVRTAVTGAEVGPMLAGLSAAKITGLSLFPEGLRHPFGVGTPLLTVADFHGGTIRTPTSATGDAVITALGGTPTSSEVGQGSRGAESEYLLAPSGTTATGNVVLFPKVNVLVANSAALAKLTADQRTILRQAAAATQRWVDGSVSDATAAIAYCKQGGKVAEASDADIAALTAAAEPVRTALDGDAGTKRIIDALAAEVGPSKPIAVPSACTVSTTVASPALTAMDGTWVVPSTAEAMTKAGALDPDFIDENAGTLVITFHGDAYTWIEIPQQGHTPNDPNGLGDLTERGGAVTVYWSHAAGESTTATPHRTADGRLAFTDLQDPKADVNARALDVVQFVQDSPWTPLAKAIEGTWRTTVRGAAASLHLADGRWTLQRAGASTSGSYAMKDDAIAITWPGGGTTTAAVGPNTEGGLTFQAPAEAGTRSGADRVWDLAAFAQAWTKG